MVTTLTMWFSADAEATVAKYVDFFKQKQLALDLRPVAEITPKFLKQHPQFSLLLDANGFWIAAEGMRAQANWGAEIPRLKRASINTELLARACQLDNKPRLIDATAGLGHDSLLLAWLGADVTMVERDPVIYCLLQDAMLQMQNDPTLASTMSRMQLIYADAEEYLKLQSEVDVVYLDPMFPKRFEQQHKQKKQAKAKKQMQLFQAYFKQINHDDLGEDLLTVAIERAKRVIVKRPHYAQPLADIEPHHQWISQSSRFDAYFQASFRQ